jgi:diguanylate cyclase (GGDEF)-like protein
MGDKVLKDVAADLAKMFRNTDVISRLGGDEFIIYMKAVPEEDWVRKRTEEVVRTVRRWVTDGTTNIQVSASVGVVSTNGMERVYEEMYRAADIAMYFSKGQGGNQAIFYSKDLVSQARGTAPTTREDEGEAETAKTLAEHNGMTEEAREAER